MKKALAFFLFITCLTWKSFSQADSVFTGTLQAYIIPLPWIDKNPRLRLGIEYHAQEHKSYSLEVGFGDNFINESRLDKSVWGQDYTFFEVRPEIKWFLKNKSNLPWYVWKSSALPRYFAIEGFYQEMHDQLADSDFNPKSSEMDIAYDLASFKKIKIGAHAKLGVKFLLWKKVVLDFYEGIGLAYRKITYYDVMNPRPFDDFGSNEEWWPEPYKNEGAYFLFQLSLGVRVGYVFGKV